MRLFLSAGTVRRVRIVLLRATHLPFVLMIGLYESSQRKLHHSTSRSPSLVTGRPHTSTSASEPGMSRCQDPLHPSVVEATRSSNGYEQTNVDRHDAHEPGLVQPGQAQVQEMIDAVERLRTQVERVSMTLAIQHSGN